MPLMKRLLPLFALTLSTPALAGGLTLHFEGHEGADKTESTAYIEGKSVRTDATSHDASGKISQHTLIFDGAKSTVTLIEADKHTYRVLTAADLQKVADRAAQARAQLESRLNSLPPERRHQMQTMMAMRGLGGPLALHFAPTGEKKTVATYACEVYQITDGDRPFQTACIAPWASGPVKKSELAAVHALAVLMANAGPAMAQVTIALVDLYPGLPIERVSAASGGMPPRTATLVSLKRGTIGASRFERPAGLTLDPTPLGGAAPGPALAPQKN